MFDISKVLVYIKKRVTMNDIILLGIAKILFFITRLYNIKLLPIFNDEGIYIHWAKVAWHDASWRFISLTDGKQPLQTWGTIPFLKLFPNDALLAGRLFSVATGFVTLIGMFCLLYYLFGKKTAFIGMFLSIFSPYFLFYDRIAMVDSGVNAAFIWILFLSIVLVRTIRLDVALMFGLCAGIALLTKSSAQMFLAVSFFTSLLLVDYKKRKISGILSFTFLYGVVFLLSQIIYNVQRLSPFMHYLSKKNTTFVMTFAEWVKSPFEVVMSNLKTVPYYVFSESGWIVVPFALVAFYLLYKKNIRLFLYFLAWMVIPYLGIAFMTRVLFPRYIMFFASLLIILTAYVLGEVKNKKILVGLMSLVIGTFLIFQYPMWTDYTKIIFPDTDRGQYITGVTVGLGAEEIIAYAREQSHDKPVRIIAQGDFGMTGDILDTFLQKDDRIFIQGYWPLTKEVLLKHQVDLTTDHVYVVTAHELQYPPDWPMKRIKAYYKLDGKSALQLFELTK
jgi:4-amino-4-deoxy-L-arabinose transferase-like glycosyltransferase